MNNILKRYIELLFSMDLKIKIKKRENILFKKTFYFFINILLMKILRINNN